ncbi:MAG: ABC transporter permease [Flavobacteriales bacterium]|nr:putative multidrug ABC transporter permease YbhR [Flavobacteriales bacterium]MCC6577410.1 ABC transporter permease [Flavobacteriales bacterium]NUQ13829.1 ABC transporter permease [Flavobacteriales bacterium]
MSVLPVLLRKEFRQIFRNKSILTISLAAPIMQFIVLPLAANYEFKNIDLAVVDNDRSDLSRQMIDRITGSGYFRLVDHSASYAQAYALIESDEADLILQIPSGFERDLVREGREKVFVAVNAINGLKAGVGGAYLTAIIAGFNRSVVLDLMPTAAPAGIAVTSSGLFNPRWNYQIALIPGILAILVTMIGGMLSALNIVKEKETGTIEQINVTPIRKRDFILAKLIPFWLLANVVFTIGLVVAYLIYGIVPQGSLLLLYGFIGVYLLAVLGFGLLVSTYCTTQQQAVFVIFFFLMIFILMGGLFTPLDSMPDWARTATRFNPLTHMIEVMRLVILKASTFRDILPNLLAVAAMAVVLNVWAVLNYRKTS